MPVLSFRFTRTLFHLLENRLTIGVMHVLSQLIEVKDKHLMDFSLDPDSVSLSFGLDLGLIS